MNGSLRPRLAQLVTALPLTLVVASLVVKNRVAIGEVDPTLATRTGSILAASLAGTVLALVPWALLPTRPRLRALGLALVSVGLGIVCLANLLSFRQFGDLISIAALRYLGLATDVHSAIAALFRPSDALFFADAVVLMVLAAIGPRWLDEAFPRRSRRAVFVLAALGLAGALFAGAVSPRRRVGYVGSTARSGDLGLVGYQVLDSWRYLVRVTGQPRSMPAEVDAFVAQIAARRTPASALAGVAKGRSLLVIQLESMQDFLVDFDLDGAPAMPRLRALGAESLRFTQLHSETGQAGTADAELLTNCSLHPSEKGAVHVELWAREFRCLPWLTARNGYSTVAAHANRADFWNRSTMFPLMGFGRFDAEKQFVQDERIGLGLSDRSFYRQLVERLDEGPRPFHAFAISLTSHGPFDFAGLPRGLPLGRWEGTRVGHYLRAAHYTDEALGALIDDLAARGLLDELVLVVYGDHTGLYRQNSNLGELLPIPAGDEAAWFSAEKRIPMFIRLPHGAHAGRIDEVMGQIDLAPTIAGLLGLSVDGTAFVGRDVLADGTGEVGFPDGSALDDRHLFRSSGMQERSCFSRGGGVVAASECDGLRTRAAAAVSLSRTMLEGDAVGRVADRLSIAGEGG